MKEAFGKPGFPPNWPPASKQVDGGISEFEGERLLMATGITPDTKALNLEAAGVRVDGHGFIETDDYMRTSNHEIFAAGDVAGRMPLAMLQPRKALLRYKTP